LGPESHGSHGIAVSPKAFPSFTGFVATISQLAFQVKLPAFHAADKEAFRLCCHHLWHSSAC